MSITSVLAAYGALLSSIGFGWTLYRDLLDRASLKVTVAFRRIVPSPSRPSIFFVSPHVPCEGKSAQIYLVMTVTNTGRRPVRWDSWGGDHREPMDDGGDHFAVLPRELPKMLYEGNSHSEWGEVDHNLAARISNWKRVVAIDATGKKWNLSRHDLKALVRELHTLQAQGDIR
jgi:hypothetical protein